MEIKMPQLGQTTDEVRIIRWLVREGQKIKEGQPLCEVETDKVTMELESIAGGVISGLLAKPDDIVTAGDVIAIIDEKSLQKEKTKKLPIEDGKGYKTQSKKRGQGNHNSVSRQV